MHKNEKDFAHAYATYADQLFRYSLFKVSDRDTALDLVQETFTKTWAALVAGTTIENSKAFLYTTLQHLIVDHYRAKGHDSLDRLAEAGFDPTDTKAPDLVDQLDGARALALIAELPPDTRDVIFFRFVNELSFAEIAAITGESINTLTVRAHRGIQKLKVLATTPHGT